LPFLRRLRRAGLAAALLLAACTSAPEDVRESRFIMGTLVTFTVSDTPRQQALAAIKAAADEMQRIQNTFTIYGDTPNAVKAFNHQPPGRPMPLPAEVDALLQTSLAIARASGGAFSPALGAPDLLWGFSLPDAPHAPPPARALTRAMQGADWRLLAHTPQGWVRQHASTQLDFGGIAKGYAIDRAIAVLRQHGVRHAIVDAGGDMRLIGSHHGRPWRIGIRHPRRKTTVLGWLEAQGDIAIVTSGDYERFFIWHGKRWHHILDPSTGQPARRAMSATVIASDATRADAWSTALFVLGAEGLPLIRQNGMRAVLVDAAGRVHATPDLQGGVSPVAFHPAGENP